MSVYRDTNADVVFEHPFQGPLTATVYRDGNSTPVKVVPGIANQSGRFTLGLTYRETQFDGRLKIVWTGTESDSTAFTRSSYVDVVTPILSLSDIRGVFLSVDPDSIADTTDTELSELEVAVRLAVQAYCRQSFGYSEGTRTYVGNGSKTLALKERCSRLDTFGGGWPGQVSVSDDGWSLYLDPNQFLTVRESPPIEFLNYVTNGVIQVPDVYIKAFNTGETFTLTGVWGYEVVPSEVQEAAKLLVVDFAANDSTYRDRYLLTVKAQQDTITYHPGAFRGTGNARADLLLGKWRRSGMVII